MNFELSLSKEPISEQNINIEVKNGAGKPADYHHPEEHVEVG